MADIYSDDEQFGRAVGELVQVAGELQAAAKHLGSAIGGELGPPVLDKAVVVAAQIWAKGAGHLATAAGRIASNISTEIRNYSDADLAAQATFARAIAGEDVDSRSYTRPYPGAPGNPLDRGRP